MLNHQDGCPAVFENGGAAGAAAWSLVYVTRPTPPWIPFGLAPRDPFTTLARILNIACSESHGGPVKPVGVVTGKGFCACGQIITRPSCTLGVQLRAVPVLVEVTLSVSAVGFVTLHPVA
jgi:hypothetical protein